MNSVWPPWWHVTIVFTSLDLASYILSHHPYVTSKSPAKMNTGQTSLSSLQIPVPHIT